jgi:hypothetical protein
MGMDRAAAPDAAEPASTELPGPQTHHFAFGVPASVSGHRMEHVRALRRHVQFSGQGTRTQA